MRALIAALVCIAVLAGATLAVARTADNTAATMRTNAAQALIDGADCGCTADVRAKDRIANRDTANETDSK